MIARRAESHPPAAFFKAARIVIPALRALRRIGGELDLLAWEAEHGRPPKTLPEFYAAYYRRKLNRMRLKSSAILDAVPFNKTALLGAAFNVPISLEPLPRY